MRRGLFLVLAVTFAPDWAVAESAQDAATASVFLLNCAGCHRADGHGLPSHGIPDLAGTGVLAGSEAGRRFLIQVPGVAQSRLDDAEVAEMLDWVIRRYAATTMPPGFRPFTAAEVAASRGETAHDPNGRRAAVLAGLPPAASPSAAPAQPY
jgi:mono/diheme cytochrome c family protein